MYYQAIDDEISTMKILELQQAGYNISFDPYNINNSYPNGNIKYFSYGLEWTGDEKRKETIAQFADELTVAEARKIFPEDFYFGRAYYQVKDEVSSETLYARNGKYCKYNKDNFYPNGNIKYFWVDYYGSMSDFEHRARILEFADELPTSIAIELMRADELAEYHHSLAQSDKDKIRNFMESPYFSKRYQKAIRRTESGKIPNEEEFARAQLEESEKHLIQKRLNSATRTRKITIYEMIEEIDNIAKNWYEIDDKIGKEVLWRLHAHKISFDDVILLLSDVILTEDEAKCIAGSWALLKRIKGKEIQGEFITDEQVRDLFPELYEEKKVNKKSAEIVAKLYNSHIEGLKQQRAEQHKQKIEKLKSMRAEKPCGRGDKEY